MTIEAIKSRRISIWVKITKGRVDFEETVLLLNLSVMYLIYKWKLQK